MRRLPIALRLVSTLVFGAGCGRVGGRGVQAGIEELASISAESALIADDLARARTKTTFVRAHGAELSAHAQHEAEKLNDAPVAPA